MTWIRVTPRDEAEGLLEREYQAAERRSGRVWGIVAAMSPNPRALKTSMAFYTTIMHGPSPLSRVQREMLAVVVSVANACHY